LKNQQAIILLFIANSISGFAQGITMLAIPWYFAHELKQPSLFAWIYFAITVGSMIWGTYAGTLVDKFNRKKLFLYQSIFGMSVLGASSFYGFTTGEVPLWMISFVFMFTIFIYNIHYPNLYAFAQEITNPKDYGRINSYIEIQGQLTTMVAGAIAALLISSNPITSFNFFGKDWQLPFTYETWSIHKVFALDAFTYILAFLVILMIKYTPVVNRKIESGNVFNRLQVGFDFLKKHKMVFLFGTLSYAVFATILVGVHFLVPNFIDQILKADASVYATTELLFALGSVFAGFAIRKIFSKTNVVVAILTMTAIVAFFYIAINVNSVIWLFYIAFFMIGLSNAGSRIMRITYLFDNVPNQVIGRVNAVFRVLNIFFRLLFIGLFAMPLFTSNLKLPFYVFAVFLSISIVLLMIFYKPIIEQTVSRKNYE